MIGENECTIFENEFGFFSLLLLFLQILTIFMVLKLHFDGRKILNRFATDKTFIEEEVFPKEEEVFPKEEEVLLADLPAN